MGTFLYYTKELSCMSSGMEFNQISFAVKLINMYDIWDKDDIGLFNKGILLSNYVFNNPINIPTLKRQFNFELIKHISRLFNSGYTTRHVENTGHYNILLDKITKLEYSNHPNSIPALIDENIPLGVKVELLNLPYLNSYVYDVYRTALGSVVVFTDISSSTSQYCFDYMFEDPCLASTLLNIDSVSDTIFINYKLDKNTMSIRSRNGKAVEVAKMCGGGGHPDAAGAKLGGIDELVIILESINTSINKL